jgi:hypothetical protein
MKKLLLAGVIGVFALGMLSCGGGHGSCDAYRKSDYTKFKAEKTKKIELSNFILKAKDTKKK